MKTQCKDWEIRLQKSHSKKAKRQKKGGLLKRGPVLAVHHLKNRSRKKTEKTEGSESLIK